MKLNVSLSFARVKSARCHMCQKMKCFYICEESEAQSDSLYRRLHVRANIVSAIIYQHFSPTSNVLLNKIATVIVNEVTRCERKMWRSTRPRFSRTIFTSAAFYSCKCDYDNNAFHWARSYALMTHTSATLTVNTRTTIDVERSWILHEKTNSAKENSLEENTKCILIYYYREIVDWPWELPGKNPKAQGIWLYKL